MTCVEVQSDEQWRSYTRIQIQFQHVLYSRPGGLCSVPIHLISVAEICAMKKLIRCSFASQMVVHMTSSDTRVNDRVGKFNSGISQHLYYVDMNFAHHTRTHDVTSSGRSFIYFFTFFSLLVRSGRK